MNSSMRYGKSHFLKILFIFSIPGYLAISCTPEDTRMNLSEFETELLSLSEIDDDHQRDIAADSLWAKLERNDQIPFTQDSTAIFLYKGEGNEVAWNGDFNNWSGNSSIDNKGTKLPGTNIWYWKTTFPNDARLDYKITIDEDWILDPVNPHYQWSGFGPNSEIRMPDYEAEPLTERIPEATKGNFHPPKFIQSTHMGYDIAYRVYIPNGYEAMEDLPVLYTTDGHEYSDDRLGASIIVLDNLIHLGEIEPVIVVFVDPRDPNDQAQNRRADEFGNNENYLKFFTDELIPAVDNSFKTNPVADERAILGTSLGGLNATYFGFMRPDIFGKMAIQAPAFWYREEIYDLVRNTTLDNPDIYMSVGTIGDNTEDARKMKAIFEEKGLNFSYTEVNEGHSWGAWSAQMDDILIQFFKK